MEDSKYSNLVVTRLVTSGYRSASSIDLIAAGFARRETDASEEMARNLLREMGKLQSLGEVSPQALRELTGLDGFDLVRVQALLELGRRIGQAGKGEEICIDDPEDVATLFSHLRTEKKEHFCSLLLDTKNKVIRTTTVHIGTVNASIVGPREVFREAIREGASSIIVVHNHPSGDPTPSPEDIQVTALLKEVGAKLDIPVLDHLVIGYSQVYSFSRGGYFQCHGKP